jgi:hypothetical protein
MPSSRGLIEVLSWPSLEGQRKPREFSVMITVVAADVQAEHLSNVDKGVILTSEHALCRVYPLLRNDLVNTFPRKRTRATIRRPLLYNGPVSTPP